MSFEFCLGNTGNDVVDSLQGLQRIADQLDSPDDKIARIKRGIEIVRTGELIGHQFMVSAATILSKRPDDAPDTRFLFKQGMTFSAELAQFRYVVDQDIPLDSLTLCFVHPAALEMIDDAEASKRFADFKLQVPVLAIDSCVDLAA